MHFLSAVYSDESICRRLVETCPIGIVLSNESGQVVLMNPTGAQLLGYAEDEWIQRAPNALSSLSSAELFDAPLSSDEAADHSTVRASVSKKVMARRKNGTELSLDVRIHSIASHQGRFCLAYFSEAGERNLSEQDLSNRATQDRLALIGQLSGSVAHEIRTPLSVIRNDVYFLQSQADRLGPEASDAIEEINESLAKATRIVNELLDFAQEPPFRPSSAKMKSILSSALKSIRLTPQVQLTIDKSLDNLVVLANADQIERILINLLRNAIQAMEGEGKILVRGEQASNEIMIDVIDDGPGIEDGDIERIFEPLFTTKSKGIGLGLAISQRYARKNRGNLIAVPFQQRGAWFRLTLPRAEALSEASHHG